MIDVKEKIIINIDNNFKNNPLEMIEIVKLAVQHDFKIDYLTFNAIKDNAQFLKQIDSERMRDELDKFLLIDSVQRGIYLLSDTGLLYYILPELEECKGVSQDNPHHDYDIFGHIVRTVENIKPTVYLRLTMLLHDLGKLRTKSIDENGIGHFYYHEIVSTEIAEKILIRMKYDDDITKKVLMLIKHHDYRINADTRSVKKAINKIGRHYFEDYLLIRQADIKAQSKLYIEQKLENLNTIIDIYKDVIENEEVISINELEIDEHDLISIGIEETKGIKRTLEYLLEKVMEDPELNQKEKLIYLARGSTN